MYADPVTGAQSRAERKEQTRTQLLECTLDLSADRGLAGVSLREIARAAGIVPTAFYRHFDSMDALGLTLVDDGMRALRSMLRDLGFMLGLLVGLVWVIVTVVVSITTEPPMFCMACVCDWTMISYSIICSGYSA